MTTRLASSFDKLELHPWRPGTSTSTEDDPQARPLKQGDIIVTPSTGMCSVSGVGVLSYLRTFEQPIFISMPSHSRLSSWVKDLCETLRLDTGTQEQDREQSVSLEMDWLTTHAQDLSRYRGEWLLISGQALKAHSHDMAVIRLQIASHRIAKPFLYYVPTAEEANFIF